MTHGATWVTPAKPSAACQERALYRKFSELFTNAALVHFGTRIVCRKRARTVDSAEMWIQAVRRNRIFALPTDQDFALRPVHERVIAGNKRLTTRCAYATVRRKDARRDIVQRRFHVSGRVVHLVRG